MFSSNWCEGNKSFFDGAPQLVCNSIDSLVCSKPFILSVCFILSTKTSAVLVFWLTVSEGIEKMIQVAD